MNHVVLLISCPDQPGLVARVTGELFKAGANVLTLEQHVEADNQFFMRIYAELAPGSSVAELDRHFVKLRDSLNADISLRNPAVLPKVAILVSTEQACLHDLLIRHKSNELRASIPLIISNQQTLQDTAEMFAIPFHHIPNIPNEQGKAESAMTQLLEAAEIDLVVLARYMRILSAKFVSPFSDRMINIHHSFLPAFKGNKPYHQAWERGVKIIGATAHYVIPELDEGPIISQDTRPVTHQYSPEQMAGVGRDIERRVLAEAVVAHVEHRIIRHRQRTIVFHP